MSVPARTTNVSSWSFCLCRLPFAPGSYRPTFARANPRDSLKDSIVATNLHRVVRRTATYGPALPDGVLEAAR